MSTEYVVSQSADDAHLYGASFGYTQTLQEIGNSIILGSCSAAFRFNNVNIPNGGVCTSAYLSLWITAVVGSPILQCIGIDEDNTNDFSANPFGRAQTTAVVNFSAPQWDTLQADQWCNSPDISTIINEIVARAGWAALNNLGLFVNDNGSAGGHEIGVHTWNLGDHSHAPKLTLTLGAQPSQSTGGTGSMGANIPAYVTQGSRLRAVFFDGYVLNEISRHVYNEQGATGDQVKGAMVSGYSQKTVACSALLGKTVTQISWAIEGRSARNSAWTVIEAWNQTPADARTVQKEVTGEWDWLRVGCYISGGTNADNPLITAILNARKAA